MTIDLTDMDATAQAELVARGELHALELVDAAIARIEAIEPHIGALASTGFEQARKRARSAPRGAFGGVPLLVKDLLAVPGYPCEFGSRLFRGNIPAEGSPFTERLEAAGFVVLGKTTTSELGLLGSTETLAAGTTHNPWGNGLSATGSSGGSAAAVAAGMVPMAHASDGGGSIRIPASVCGVFGFKPSRGRCVSAGPGDMGGLVADLSVSRTVRDTARMLDVVEDRETALPSVGFVAGPSPRRLRIGVYRQTLMGADPDAAVAEVLERTVQLCRSLGHEVTDAPPPPIDGAAVSSSFFTVAGAGVAQLADMMHGAPGHAVGSAELEPFTLELLGWFRKLPPHHLTEAVATIGAQGAAMRQYAERYDALLCPTLPCEPPRLGFLAPDLDRETILRRTETLAGYTAIHNMAGLPAMSMPLFLSAAGLPVGSQFAAPLGHDATLLGLAYELEAACPRRLAP